MLNKNCMLLKNNIICTFNKNNLKIICHGLKQFDTRVNLMSSGSHGKQTLLIEIFFYIMNYDYFIIGQSNYNFTCI